MVNTLLFINNLTEGRERRVTSTADYRYRTQVKNYLNFTRAQLWLFSELEILVTQLSLCNKYFQRRHLNPVKLKVSTYNVQGLDPPD